ncbi:MAG: hypothetical protein IJ343_08725 [Clostridia bacterium]|nr:hypothetical protein [Clostridia bacterium]
MKRLRLCLLLLILLCLTACSQMEVTHMPDTVWTQNQRNIFAAYTGNPDRLDHGPLLERERAMLQLVADADAYLTARYGAEFVFVDATSPLSGDPAFIVKGPGSPRTFTVRITNENGKKNFADGYYNLLKEGELNSYAQQLLTDAGLQAKTWLYLGGYSDSLSADKSLREEISAGTYFSVAGTIYVCAPDSADSLAAVDAALQGHGLCGYVTIAFVSGMPEGAPADDWLLVHADKVLAQRGVSLKKPEVN